MGILATNLANGNGSPVNFARAKNPQGQLTNTLFVGGTFGGATVTLEASPDVDGATLDRWYAVTSVTGITAQSCVNFFVQAKRIRVVVASGDGSEEIDAEYI